MARQNDLGRDDVKKLVYRLAIPSMLAQFVNVLYSIVDRMFIGNIPQVGEVALAGAGVCGPIVTLLSSFAFLVGIGGAPLLAMRLGEGNQKGAEQILSNCFVMLVGMAVALTAIFIGVRRPMLMLFGASANTFPYANDYLVIYTLGTIFAILATGLNQFIICQGFSTVAMATVLVGAALNILLDPVFIFLLDMGVKGAALATVLSQAASCAFVVKFLFGMQAKVRITFGGYSWKIMRRVLTFGFSPFIIIATDSILIIALNMVLQHHGGEMGGDMLIACVTIVQSYLQIVTLPLGGITSGTQPILSFNYGAKQIQRIKEGEKQILRLAVTFNTVMLLVSQMIPGVFVRLFTQVPEYIELSKWGIRVFTAGIIVLAFQYTFVDGFTALGISRVAISLSLFRKAVFLTATILLPQFFGAKAAFFAEPVADIFCGCVTSCVFLLLFKKILQRRQEMPDGQALYS